MLEAARRVAIVSGSIAQSGRRACSNQRSNLASHRAQTRSEICTGGYWGQPRDGSSRGRRGGRRALIRLRPHGRFWRAISTRLRCGPPTHRREFSHGASDADAIERGYVTAAAASGLAPRSAAGGYVARRCTVRPAMRSRLAWGRRGAAPARWRGSAASEAAQLISPTRRRERLSAAGLQRIYDSAARRSIYNTIDDPAHAEQASARHWRIKHVFSEPDTRASR